MTTPPALRQMRHDVWATQRLIERCRALREEQLDLVVPGTYGTIRRMLTHIVRADEGYLQRLGILEDPRIEEADTTTLDEIEKHLATIRAGIERLFAQKDFDPDRRMHSRDVELEPWILITQFSHHGSDHRSQVCTTLSVNRLDVPDLDVWAYGDAEGVIVPDAR
jgi:uncharacterized damage-inducible protein DinB